MLSNDVGTCSWLVEELGGRSDRRARTARSSSGRIHGRLPLRGRRCVCQTPCPRGVLSKYQAKRALDGEAKKLMLGAYVLVEVIGNGSLGPVYKARRPGRSKALCGESPASPVVERSGWRSQVRAFEGLPPTMASSLSSTSARCTACTISYGRSPRDGR